jgi:hypothetical protein
VARMNKTKSNLQYLWDLLDEACGNLDQAFTHMSMMTDIPEEIKKSAEMIDFNAIVNIKNEIEKLIEEKDGVK